MKREIKFRGKRIDNGEWVYGYFVKDPNEKCRIFWQPFKEASNHTYHFVFPESVAQFTGLRDNDGVEIYECTENKVPQTGEYQDFFKFMSDQHGLILLESEMREIFLEVQKITK